MKPRERVSPGRTPGGSFRDFLEAAGPLAGFDPEPAENVREPIRLAAQVRERLLFDRAVEPEEAEGDTVTVAESEYGQVGTLQNLVRFLLSRLADRPTS